MHIVSNNSYDIEDVNCNVRKSFNTTTTLNEEYRQANTQCPWCKSQSAIVKNEIFYCHRCSYEHDISGSFEIKVIGWTTNKDNDYLSFECRSSKIYNAIVKEIKDKGYCFEWSAHQSDKLPCTPVINNGYKICCGPRTWGTIMAEAHGADDSNEAAYAEYAFGFVDNPVYPKKSVLQNLIIPFEIK